MANYLTYTLAVHLIVVSNLCLAQSSPLPTSSTNHDVKMLVGTLESDIQNGTLEIESIGQVITVRLKSDGHIFLILEKVAYQLQKKLDNNEIELLIRSSEIVIRPRTK